MDKRSLHDLLGPLRPIKPWYFVVLGSLCVVVCVFALRANNLHMVTLREAVYQADKNNGDTETALRDLRTYVYSHMNTDLASGSNAVHPPVQLKYTYSRLVAAENKRVNDANSKIYTDAQHYCETTIPEGFSGSHRIACIQSYVTSHGTIVRTIPKNLYQFDFISPKWSPDLAGWSLVASVFYFIVALAIWIVEIITHHNLMHKRRAE